jgi:hypothetical protein
LVPRLRQLVYLLCGVGGWILRRRLLALIQISCVLLLLAQTALGSPLGAVVAWLTREDLSHSGEQDRLVFGEGFILLLILATGLGVVGEHGCIVHDLHLVVLFLVDSIDAKVFLNVEDLALIDLVIEGDVGLGLRSGRNISLQLLYPEVSRVLLVNNALLVDNWSPLNN